MGLNTSRWFRSTQQLSIQCITGIKSSMFCFCVQNGGRHNPSDTFQRNSLNTLRRCGPTVPLNTGFTHQAVSCRSTRLYQLPTHWGSNYWYHWCQIWKDQWLKIPHVAFCFSEGSRHGAYPHHSANNTLSSTFSFKFSVACRCSCGFYHSDIDLATDNEGCKASALSGCWSQAKCSWLRQPIHLTVVWIWEKRNSLG